MNQICIFCGEQVFSNPVGVFGEVMHPECEVQFFREYDAAENVWAGGIDNEAAV